MKHELFLEIPLTTNNKILRILDAGVYSPFINTVCGRLEITPPGYSQAVVFDQWPGFTLSETSCSLQLHTQGCPNEIQPLPDGIYVIRYSLAPNDKIFVEYNHLRMTRLLNCYYEKLGKVNLSDCSPSSETSKTIREFQLIKAYLDAAKAKVEYLHEPVKGMELFNYADRLLNKLENCHTC